MSIQHTSFVSETGARNVIIFAGGTLLPPVPSDHPNFEAVVDLLAEADKGGDVEGQDLLDLLDVATHIAKRFERLSDRVSVANGTIFVDGDEADGTLQQQILDFLEAGEDFDPLVKFYEKLLTNPLGDVRDGVYDWIKGQTDGGGKLTITPDGDLIGYKSTASHTRKDGTVVYRPSRPSREGGDRVNGIEVEPGQYIEQAPGDVVEMPRSKVLNEPSTACGDGLHIGTYAYASTFYGDTVLLVKFSPRDIVSLPDSNATWKLRVNRYTVQKPVTEALDVPVYLTNGDAESAEFLTGLDFDLVDLGWDDDDLLF